MKIGILQFTRAETFSYLANLGNDDVLKKINEVLLPRRKLFDTRDLKGKQTSDYTYRMCFPKDVILSWFRYSPEILLSVKEFDSNRSKVEIKIVTSPLLTTLLYGSLMLGLYQAFVLIRNLSGDILYILLAFILLFPIMIIVYNNISRETIKLRFEGMFSKQLKFIRGA